VSDYLQHGRRHKPGGTDPISGIHPGITGAYLSAGGAQTVPIPAGSQQYFPFAIDDGGGQEFSPSNDLARELFTIETVSITGAAFFNPGDYTGLSINVPGRYLLAKTAQVFGSVDGDQVTLTSASGLNASFSTMLFGNADDVIDGKLSYFEVVEVSAATGAIVPAVYNQTGAPKSVSVQMMVMLFSDETRGFIL
jgi:hypothetical protein